MNRPMDRFHCIYRSFGLLVVYIPFKGWLVKYDDYGFQFMCSGLDQPKGRFHNCRISGN